MKCEKLLLSDLIRKSKVSRGNVLTFSDWGRDCKYGEQEEKISSYTGSVQAASKTEKKQGARQSSQGEESQGGRSR